MATTFFFTSTSFLSTTSNSTSSLPSTPTPPLLYSPQRHIRAQLTFCRASSESGSLPQSHIVTKRSFSISFFSSFVWSLAGRGTSGANAAILEADDDEELLEKVKRDRKKRLEKQGVIRSSKQETGYLQDLVYKLSKVGQAIDNNDFSTASSVLGKTTDTDWVQKINIAFSKLSSSSEEKTQVDAFNSSLAKLISSVSSNDVASSKNAFVSSASAFEKWTTLTGLVEQLKGL